MKVKDAVKAGVAKLNNSPSARLDVEVLLAYALNKTRTELLTQLDFELSDTQLQLFYQFLDKRAHNCPVAYLVGTKSFNGLELIVNPHVLIPRPETESLVDAALGLIRQTGLTEVFDVGTGSGNIAIALAKRVPGLKVIASDISPQALRVAQENAKRHQVEKQLCFVESHLAEHIQAAQLIIANLPYVPDTYAVMEDILHEPALAIFGQRLEDTSGSESGNDGLDLYRTLFEQPIFKTFRGVCLIELGARQFDAMSEWLNHRFANIKIDPICNIDGSRTGMWIDFRALAQ
ncbi:MAG: peptide chain release factor N(5)-glutamine methyltransferase [Patescibacteria group bacterium]|nr:peptide chain release factor N(5)-glutamine methyltransferase [Patescibacteria group bacterium]